MEESFQLLNVHGDNDVWQTQIHMAKPLAPKQSAFEFAIVTEKLKRHKSPGIDQIPAEFITSGSGKIHSEIYKLINSIWNKEELPVDWKELINVKR